MSTDKTWRGRGRRLADPMPAEAGELHLTLREWQVLTLMAQGLENKQIGLHLGGLSPRTIEIYRARAIEKLDGRSSVHAAVIAVQRGITSLDVIIPEEKRLTKGRGKQQWSEPATKWLQEHGRFS